MHLLNISLPSLILRCVPIAVAAAGALLPQSTSEDHALSSRERSLEASPVNEAREVESRNVLQKRGPLTSISFASRRDFDREVGLCSPGATPDERGRNQKQITSYLMQEDDWITGRGQNIRKGPDRIYGSPFSSNSQFERMGLYIWRPNTPRATQRATLPDIKGGNRYLITYFVAEEVENSIGTSPTQKGDKLPVLELEVFDGRGKRIPTSDSKDARPSFESVYAISGRRYFDCPNSISDKIRGAKAPYISFQGTPNDWTRVFLYLYRETPHLQPELTLSEGQNFPGIVDSLAFSPFSPLAADQWDIGVIAESAPRWPLRRGYIKAAASSETNASDPWPTQDWSQPSAGVDSDPGASSTPGAWIAFPERL
ncbi:MAG: hypothetical protein M1825_001972 [Sarcosagium campestre]|nr:MAG: hypothetical protein M1825_001972 [Sarcosagium campestre]